MTDKHVLCTFSCAAEGLELKLRNTEKELRKTRHDLQLLNERLKTNIRQLVKEELADAKQD